MNPSNSEVANRGNAQDLNFLKEEKWLKKSIVNYSISKQKGRYWVCMVYTHPENPLQLLVRKIDHYRDMQTAERFAKIMIKGIRRDPSGTPKIKNNAIYICAN